MTLDEVNATHFAWLYGAEQINLGKLPLVLCDLEATRAFAIAELADIANVQNWSFKASLEIMEPWQFEWLNDAWGLMMYDPDVGALIEADSGARGSGPLSWESRILALESHLAIHRTGVFDKQFLALLIQAVEQRDSNILLDLPVLHEDVRLSEGPLVAGLLPKLDPRQIFLKAWLPSEESPIKGRGFWGILHTWNKGRFVVENEGTIVAASTLALHFESRRLYVHRPNKSELHDALIDQDLFEELLIDWADAYVKEHPEAGPWEKSFTWD